jgi:aspartyl-tRNA(Asn)/glutamyl-tRNA(Gln) amidotransferase subunit A
MHNKTLVELSKALHKGEYSSVELTHHFLDRIKKYDVNINSFITVTDDEALKAAKAADQIIANGDASLYSGIPLAHKDIFCTHGVKTSCGSKMLDNFIAPYNATVVEKCQAAGMVMLGKTNMDEFAMGSSTEHSAFGPTRNPWDITRIPGGSSGGSAAAVAADLCLGALGSDTGGSIRQPAAHCGVVGLKPTYGRVSRFGLVAFASSLDQIGPLAKDVTDCALLLNVIAGYDPADSTSVPRTVPDYTDSLTPDLTGVTVGIPEEYQSTDGLDPDVSRAVTAAVEKLKLLGARIISVSLPHTAYAVAAYYVIAPSEASSNLARYDGVKYGWRDTDADTLIDMYRHTRASGFGPEVQRRIIIGTYALSAGYYDAYYGKASQVRTLIINDFQQAFEQCDVIASPVTPTPAWKIGELADDPLSMYLSDIFTLSANLAGIPGLSIPCGFSGKGLPIGLQLMGPHFAEDILLKVAYNFEQATDFHRKKPDI